MRNNLINDFLKNKKESTPKWIRSGACILALCFFCNISAAKIYPQTGNISLKTTKTSIQELFAEIEKSTNYSILYERGIADNKEVSIETGDASVEDILDKVLPTVGLTYKVNDNQIIIIESSKPKADQVSSTKQSNPSYSLTGIVVDSTGEPLIGAHIIIKGTTDGVITDIDGRFTINITRGLTLNIKSLGFKDQEIFITDQRNIKITMAEDAEQLEDVVIVGYGTQKKASVVGSVQTIRPAELKVPSSRLSNSFAGRLAGVVSVQRTGEPGADGADFWIRGISTFAGTAAQKPLIIIDGVEVSTGDLNNLEPEVIESFSVLKDATATALYGTRGANGVVIVATKTGADLDKPIINARLEATFSTPTKIPKFVSGTRYMQMYNEAVLGRNSTSEPLYSQDKIRNTAAGLDPLAYPNVDWYDELFNNLSIQEKAVVNIRGGGKKMNYFMNVSIGHESGMLKSRSKDYYSFKNNIDLKRYNFQNNITLNATSTTKISLRLNTQLYDYTGPYEKTDNLFSNVMNANPVDFPVSYPSNDPRNQSEDSYEYIAWGGKNGGKHNNGYLNPVAELVKGYKDLFESTVIANLDLEQKLDFITPGLEFKALASFKNWSSSTVKRSAGYNQFEMNNNYNIEDNLLTNYTISRVGSEQGTILGTETDREGDRRIYFQTMLDYNRTFNKIHAVNLMFLYNQEQYNINALSASAEGGDGNTKMLTLLPQRKQGFAGRFTYSYDYKYLFEANFGYNGSESFAEGHRWGFFPSFAIGYNISEEKFWSPIKDIVSNFKIRASWGLVGNDKAVERFIYLANIDLTGKKFTTGREMDTSESGPIYNRYQNNNITWEVGEKWNAGADIQLFYDLNIMLDLFYEKRRDIFLQRQTIPNYMGTAETKVFGNLGKVENKGFDLSLDYAKNFTRDFFMSFKATFTYAANKILDYDEPAYMSYPTRSKVGHSVNQMDMYIADRLYIDQADINSSANQVLGGYIVQPGDIKYVNQPDYQGNYNELIDENDKLWYGYPTVPEIVYGFGPSFQYKNWDFSFFFQGTARTSLMMSGFHPFGSQDRRNVLKFIADDYWSETNQNPYAAYPRLSKTDNGNNNVSSTYWLRDASFLKLKNAEVGYTIKNFRVYATGANLLTFSKFKLWDPEMGGGAGLKYPTQRVFNVGVQVTFK